MSQLSRTLENSFNRFSDRRLVTLKSDFVYDRYTYGTIKNISLRLVTFFEKNNIKKGDKVTICSYNSPQYIYTFLASIFSGVILVPIDYGSSEDLVKKFMEKTESKFLITSKYKIINLKIKKIFIEDMDEVLASHKKGNIDRTIKDEDLFQILFTSGTTGDPKGVKISHENILSNIRSVLRVLKIKKHYRLLSLIPLSHIFEQVAGFFIIAASGAQTTQLKSRRPSEIIKIFQKEKINVIATVPAFLMLFKRKIENKAKENRKFKKLKKVLNFARKLPLPIRRRIFKDIHKVFGKKLEIMISGGAPLPRDAEIFWESTGIRIVQGYGLTETSPVLALGDIYDRRVGSVGKVVPGVRMKLNDDGEVLVRGKNITKGYYKNPEATEDLFENGWLKTGDV